MSSRLACARAAAVISLALLLAWPSPVRPSDQPAQPAGTPPPPPAPDLDALLKDGRFADVERMGRDLLRQAETEHGADSPEAGEVLDVLVEAMRNEGKLRDPEVREFARRAITIREKNNGPGSPEVARCLNNLANLLAEAGDYAGAKPLFERVLTIQENALGKDAAAVGSTLNNLANVISDMGDYAGSVPLYERSIAIKEKALGKDDPKLVSSLVNFAILLRLMGDYTRARQVAERAIDIAQTKLRPEHPRVATGLATLASIFVDAGDYDEARRLDERALAIRRKELDPNHPDVASSLNDLATLDEETGDLASARRLFEQSLAIQQNSLEPDSGYLVTTLDNLGEVVQRLGDPAGAKKHYARALEIVRTQFGPDHPENATSLEHLAALLEHDGRDAEARPLLEQALEVRERSLGADHPLYAATLSRMASLLFRAGETDAAFADAHRAERTGRDHLRLTARTLPERQALRYSRTRATGIDVELAIAAGIGIGGAPGVPGAPEDNAARRAAAWDDLIRSRALVLDEMAARHRAAAGAGDREVATLFSDLDSARARLAALAVRGPEDQPADYYRELLAQARHDAERAEGTLAEKSLAFRQGRDREMIGLDEVRRAMPPDSALVAFVLFHPPQTAHDTTPAAEYLAFILRSGRTDPMIERLGPAERIDQLALRWRRAAGKEPSPLQGVAEDDERAYKETAAELRRAVWDPIARHLRGAATVFIVGDGSLGLVSFATLPDRDGRYLMESGPRLHYLSAERDLVRAPRVARPPAGEMLVIGSPDFDAPPRVAHAVPVVRAASAARAAEPPADADAAMSGSNGQPAAGGYRSPPATCATLQSLRFTALPASGLEADAVERLLRSRPAREGAQAVLKLQGAEADEEAFKTNAPRYRHLHVATHGFFMDDECRSVRDVSGMDNPLLLTGLAFAGANRRQDAAASQRADDGMLTAEEIASLDLSGVEWVVLSACETGMGKVLPGEGVLGLRRAFEVAGAGSLIMSLWKVKDEPTRAWMNRLYEAHRAGLGAGEALRKASRDIIESRRAAGDTTHPFFWGAFVAAGDWR